VTTKKSYDDMNRYELINELECRDEMIERLKKSLDSILTRGWNTRAMEDRRKMARGRRRTQRRKQLL
jgi:hypothetical protein